MERALKGVFRVIQWVLIVALLLSIISLIMTFVSGGNLLAAIFGVLLSILFLYLRPILYKKVMDMAGFEA